MNSIVKKENKQSKRKGRQLDQSALAEVQKLLEELPRRKELLIEAGVAGAEAVVSVTDDDEVNIFSTLLAKELGCLRSFAIFDLFIFPLSTICRKIFA